jgi:hypothetical protein
MLMTGNSQAQVHFQHLAHLLQLEADAEKQEDLRAMQRHSPASSGAEASGSCILGLVIRDQDAGL